MVFTRFSELSIKHLVLILCESFLNSTCVFASRLQLSVLKNSILQKKISSYLAGVSSQCHLSRFPSPDAPLMLFNIGNWSIKTWSWEVSRFISSFVKFQASKFAATSTCPKKSQRISGPWHLTSRNFPHLFWILVHKWLQSSHAWILLLVFFLLKLIRQVLA